MKLLLTSNGLSNDSIAQALEELVGKKPADTRIAFIPTAAHASRGENKDWLINDLWNLSRRGYFVDIIELTALKPDVLADRLAEADVIFVGGGNGFYLSYWLQKSSLMDILPELLKTKVYAGISAGSMIAGPSLVMTSQALNNPQTFFDEDYDLFGPPSESDGKTLRLVDFAFRPHLNAEHFPRIRVDYLQERTRQLPMSVYALDDQSALKIVDGTVTVVSEGQWKLFEASAGHPAR